MRQRLLIIVLLGFVTTACSPAGYPLGTPFNSSAQRRLGPTYELTPALPIGRWDNVMMLPAGVVVQVLLMDGSSAAGPVVSASADRLQIRVASGSLELPSTDVMRVDRPAGAVSHAVKDGARGAAFGAGVVGVLGLIAGHAPPPRLFLAGGIIGAQQNIQLNGGAARSMIIYLAPAAPAGVLRHTGVRGERDGH
jgi:hypothetical protein